MAIYIDADKLKQDLADLYDFGKWDPREIHFSLFDMVGNIDGEPTADVAPVVHAQWREYLFPAHEFIYCSHCNEQYYEHDLYLGGNDFPNYCPNCGARMDEDGGAD